MYALILRFVQRAIDAEKCHIKMQSECKNNNIPYYRLNPDDARLSNILLDDVSPESLNIILNLTSSFIEANKLLFDKASCSILSSLFFVDPSHISAKHNEFQFNLQIRFPKYLRTPNLVIFLSEDAGQLKIRTKKYEIRLDIHLGSTPQKYKVQMLDIGNLVSQITFAPNVHGFKTILSLIFIGYQTQTVYYTLTYPIEIK